jgi:hypothetical protein
MENFGGWEVMGHEADNQVAGKVTLAENDLALTVELLQRGHDLLADRGSGDDSGEDDVDGR